MDTHDIIIIILFITILGLSYNTYSHFHSTTKTIIDGNHNILVLCADPSEARPGVGGMDLAFLIKMSDGSIKNVSTIYPGGMVHPNATTPPDLKEAGGGDYYRLHDTLWTKDIKHGTELAQEIVELYTGQKTDIVVIVTPEAVDAVIRSIGPIYVEGLGDVSGNSIELIRYEENGESQSRGITVRAIMGAMLNATNDRSKYLAMANAALNQYNKGNIYVFPEGIVGEFAISLGMKKITN